MGTQKINKQITVKKTTHFKILNLKHFDHTQIIKQNRILCFFYFPKYIAKIILYYANDKNQVLLTNIPTEYHNSHDTYSAEYQ